MACSLNMVEAPNRKPSKLYSSLLKHYKKATNNLSKSPQLALQAYLLAYSEQGKLSIGEWQSESYDKDLLDDNGEPTIEQVLSIEDFEDVVAAESLKARQEHLDARFERIAATHTKMLDTLEKRIQLISALTGDPKAAKTLKDLKDTIKKLSTFRAMEQFIKTADSEVRKTREKFMKEYEKAEPNVGKLKRYKEYIDSFDVVDQLVGELQADTKLSEIYAGEIGIMNGIKGVRSTIESQYKELMLNKVADRLASLSSKTSSDDLKKLLKRAKGDISALSVDLSYMGDLSDEVLSLVAKLVDEQEQKTMLADKERTDKIVELTRALEEENPSAAGKPKELFKNLFQKTATGKQTTRLIVPTSSKAKGLTKAEMDFLVFYTKEYNAMQAKLPKRHRLGNEIPRITDKTAYSILKGSKKDLKGTIKEVMYNQFGRSALSNSENVMTDASGKEIKFIPIMFTSPIDGRTYDYEYSRLLKAMESDPANAKVNPNRLITIAHKKAEEKAKKFMDENISHDLSASLGMFGYMADNYSNKMEIQNILESTKDFVYDRTYEVLDSKGKNILSRSKNLKDRTLTRQGSETNSAKMLSKFLDMHIYNDINTDLGDIANRLDIAKSADALRKYASYSMLGLNLTAGVANLAMGETTQWIEAMGGEFYKPKQYAKAHKEYLSQTSSILGDVASRSAKSKVNRLDELLNFMGDYEGGRDQEGATENTKAKKLWKLGTVMFASKIGEHFIQSKGAIAYLLNIPTYDSTGKAKGNLYDAYENSEKALTIAKDTYIKEDGKLVKYDYEQQRKVSRRVRYMLRFMHGNYSKQTKVNAQADARKNLVLHLRKWVATSAEKRFGKDVYYESADRYSQGSYRSAGKFLYAIRKDLAAFKLGIISTKYSDLKEHEKAGIKRTAAEVGAIAALFGVLTVLEGMAKALDDDDKAEKYAVVASMYTVNRLILELRAFTSPTALWDLLKTPAASISLLEGASRIFSDAVSMDRYKTGDRKGDLKLFHHLAKQVPGLRQYLGITKQGFEDKLDYINLSN